MDLKKTEKLVWNHRNTFYILISIIVAVYILKSDFVYNIIKNTGGLGYIDAFFVGMFFSYGFTTMPAISVLFIIASYLNPFYVALLGSLGAVLSDYLIFIFVKKKIIKEIKKWEKDLHIHMKKRPYLKYVRTIAPFIG